MIVTAIKQSGIPTVSMLHWEFHYFPLVYCLPRAGSRSCCTCCHCTKCFPPSWWHLLFHHEWGLVHRSHLVTSFHCTNRTLLFTKHQVWGRFHPYPIWKWTEIPIQFSSLKPWQTYVMSTCIFSAVVQSGFKNHNSTWKVALSAVQKRNNGQVSSDISLTLGLKDKTNSRKRVRPWAMAHHWQGDRLP